MSLRKVKRIRDLSDMLSENPVLHVRDAAELLGVSEMTVRRDVSENAEQFAYLGGHIVPARRLEVRPPYALALEADRNVREKRAACANAAGYIRPDTTIFVDCGTTLVHLVDLIPDDVSLTVVCYALNVAERVARKPSLRLILLGGLFHAATASFSGRAGLELLDRLDVETAFLSAAGVTPAEGASCMHCHEVDTKRAAIDRARRRLLVVDSSKFGRVQPAPFAGLDVFAGVISETGEQSVAAFTAGVGA